MEILPHIFSVIDTISGALFRWIVPLQKALRLKKISNIIESKEILENCSDEFKNDFIQPNIEENIFFIQTGIKTNRSSIPKYIALQKILGGDFVLEDIAKANNYLNVEGEKIKIKIPKAAKWGSNLIVWLSFVILIVSGIVAALSINLFTPGNYYLLLIPCIIIICGMLLIQLLLYSIKPINAAIKIQNRLRRVMENNQQ